MLSSSRYSQPRDRTQVSHIAGGFFTLWATREAYYYMKVKVAQSCLTLQPPGLLYIPWNSPGQNIGVGSCFLLQGIFPTQESNSGLTHWRQTLYQLSHQGSPHNHMVGSQVFFPSPVDEYGSLTIAMCCSLVEAVYGPSPLTSILCMWPALANRMFPAGCPVDAEVWESSLALSLLFSFCSRLRWGFHHYLRFQNEKDIEQSQSQPITFISVSEVMKVGCCKPLGFEGHLSPGHHPMETNHSTDDTWDLHPGILAPDQHSPSLLWELHVSYSAVNCPLPHTGTSDSKYLKGKPPFSGLGWLLCLHSESCILVGNTTTYPFTHATYLGHILENNVFTLQNQSITWSCWFHFTCRFSYTCACFAFQPPLPLFRLSTSPSWIRAIASATASVVSDSCANA